jgi:hypothetical protein
MARLSNRWPGGILVLIATLAIGMAGCTGGGGLPGMSAGGGGTASAPASVTAAPLVTASAMTTAQPTGSATAASTAVAGQTAGSSIGAGTDAAALAAAGAMLSDLGSYRFEVTLRSSNVPAFSAGDMDITFTATIVRKPVAASHLLMEGRAEPMLGTYEVIIIGDEGWARGGEIGNAWIAAPKGEAASFASNMEMFEPGSLYGSFGTQVAKYLTRVGTEAHNGIPSIHYTADAAAEAEVGQSAGLTGSWSMDVWIAEAHAYLVGMEIAGKGVSSAGAPGELLLSIEVSHLNDSANVIEPPV